MEPRRIDGAGGRVYELSSWAPADGDEWAFRLLRLLTAASGKVKKPASPAEADEPEIGADEADGSDDEFSMNTILEMVSPEDFLRFRDACFKYTSVVETDVDGEELVRELTRNREAMRGRYLETTQILVAHIKHEFSPFLLSVGKVLGGGGKVAAKGKANGSSSRTPSTG